MDGLTNFKPDIGVSKNICQNSLGQNSLGQNSLGHNCVDHLYFVKLRNSYVIWDVWCVKCDAWCSRLDFL